jgi:Xaa-Pro aminopeptidase
MVAELTEEFADRHARTREAMRAEGFDALIVYSNAKVRGCVRYLSDYTVRAVGAQCRPDGTYHHFGSCALLFPMAGEPSLLLTDQPWDIDRAKLVAVCDEVEYVDNFGSEIGKAIAERGYRNVGIDNWFVFPAYHYLALTEAAPDTSYHGTQLVERVYRVKTAAELALMRKAQEVAVTSVEAGLAAVHVGASEFDFALAAEIAMRTHGDIETAANSIISGGPKTATGTGVPSRDDAYVMKSGDWALFDICPAYGGYAGDISRMIVAGRLADLDSGLKRMYETTLRIHDEVIAMIRPGVTPRELSRKADTIADRDGFAANRIGLLGHSLGIDMHDPPDYYWDNEPLEENFCITVEPCLLLSGRGGTRIEDVVLITSDGCEVLGPPCSTELRASG